MKRLWAWPWAWTMMALLCIENPGLPWWRLALGGAFLGRAAWRFQERAPRRCRARHVDPFGWEHRCSLHRGHDGRRHLADGDDHIDLYQWPTSEAHR